MKKMLLLTATLLSGLTLMLSTVSPAHAFVGTWTKSEYTGLCTVEIDAQAGQLCPGDDSTSGATQTQAENICDCSGEKIASWNNNGHAFKNVQYNGAPPHVNVILTYRQFSAGAPWRVFDKLWCDPDKCYGNSVP